MYVKARTILKVRKYVYVQVPVRAPRSIESIDSIDSIYIHECRIERKAVNLSGLVWSN